MSKSAIRRRAKDRCEYCGLPQSATMFLFVVDHIIAKQHKGQTLADNLALCCGLCNLHKGPNIAGIDPDSGKLVPLFNPRHQAWRDHFRKRGGWIIGRTDVGRATVQVLAMNDPVQVARRREIESG